MKSTFVGGIKHWKNLGEKFQGLENPIENQKSSIANVSHPGSVRIFSRRTALAMAS